MKHRSEEKELIDLGPEYYTQEEYVDCMRKLFQVNRFLGFFRSTKKLLRTFSKTSRLLDIGCGDGLFILNLSECFPEMTMLGMDISKESIEQAQSSLIEWQKKKKASLVRFAWQEDPLDPADKPRDPGGDELNTQQVDIILATLVCHHISDDDLVIFLQHAYAGAKQAVIINDLHRHWLPHALYPLISTLLFRNRLITHDGLVSIRRSFTRAEWVLLLAKAGITNYKITWCFPFRWQVVLLQGFVS